MLNEELKQDVIDLHNGLIATKISDEEENVPAAVMSGIIGLYAANDGSPYQTARIAEDCVNNMKDENEKLLICKQLLRGEQVRIPGMDEDFYVKTFYDDYYAKVNFNDEDDTE